MSITNVITKITVDMAGDVKRFAVKAKQYDRATRVIVVSLLWDEVPYVLDSADTVRCNVHKPDGTIAIVEGEYIAVESNVVTITLPGTALTAAGRAWADIEIETADESQQVSCQCFEIDIAKSPVDDDSIISTNEFSAMKLATKAANEAAAAATAEIEATAAAGRAASQAAAAAQEATDAANQAAEAATASIQIDATLTDNSKAAPAGMVGQIKEDLSHFGYVAPASTRYIGENLLSSPLHADKTIAGVTYTWNDSTSTWTVNGTSTGTSFNNLYNGFTTLSLPDGIEAGKTYYVEYDPSDNNIEIDYQWYDADEVSTGFTRTSKSMYITVPDNTVGCIIRLRVWSGNTANGTAPNPRIYVAVDNTSDIISALNTNGICTLGNGDYYVNNLTMPNNSTLSGIGENTVIHSIHKYSTACYTILPTNGCTVNNIRITGSDSEPNNISAFTDSRKWVVGIQITGSITSAIKLCNLTISNCDSYGINVNETGGNTRGSVIITNAKIDNCWCGLRFSANSEYNKVSNCIIRKCNRGCINNGGNNTFINTTFHGIAGFVIDGTSTNSGHGSCVGCVFNHIDNIANPDTLGGGRAVFIASLTNGFVFDGCQFWYGAIYLSNSRGVTVCNSQMGDSKQNPHITVTGSYPAFFNNIIFHQTPVISDAGGSKFTACYLDSDGSAVTG